MDRSFASSRPRDPARGNSHSVRSASDSADVDCCFPKIGKKMSAPALWSPLYAFCLYPFLSRFGVKPSEGLCQVALNRYSVSVSRFSLSSVSFSLRISSFALCSLFSISMSLSVSRCYIHSKAIENSRAHRMRHQMNLREATLRNRLNKCAQIRTDVFRCRCANTAAI